MNQYNHSRSFYEENDDSKMLKEYEMIKTVKQNVSEAALYEQLAEECCELAQAALKKSRKIRGENHTPKTMREIDIDLSNEYTDVYIVTKKIFNMSPDPIFMDYKLQRWVERTTPLTDETDGDSFE